MFPQQQAYYPQQQPGYYPQPQRGPSGLPTNQATFDAKVFIPAQYDHVQLHPAGGIAIIAIGTLLFLFIAERKKSAK